MVMAMCEWAGRFKLPAGGADGVCGQQVTIAFTPGMSSSDAGSSRPAEAKQVGGGAEILFCANRNDSGCYFSLSSNVVYTE